EAQKISWAAVLCFAMGGLTLLLSWRHKMPIIIAWSTPGAALLATSAIGFSYHAALGAFAVAGALSMATGLIKPLARAIENLPTAIASAMLAGVLVSYVLKVPAAAVALPQLVVPLIIAFFILRLWKPMWTIPVVVVLGLVLAMASGALAVDPASLGLASVVFDCPQFSWPAIISLGVPLYLVTMASQNLPGFAVMRSAGYAPPVSSCLVVTGAASIIMSPMAGPQVNMAAITASLATGPDAHPDPAQRWKVSLPYAAIYLVVGLAAGACVKILGGMPHDLVIAIAGLALFGPLLGAMAAMMKDPKDVEAAVVTFLVTASGFSLFGIGAAFWGLVVGLALWGVEHWRARREII
ncbi:MAG: benzoate/H(+) symporter BenE family transporter, partial [Aestuariivirga sp.]